MVDEGNEFIDEQVNKYKEETNDFLDIVKLLVFTSLIKKVSNKEFGTKLDKVFNTYRKKIDLMTSDSYKELDNIIYQMNEKEAKIILKKGINTEVLNKMIRKLDNKSIPEMEDKFYKIIKDYYKNTSKTLDKEYVNEVAYLRKKITQYDKVERVVPYFRKNGIAYYDISTYDSMVYNTNLTKTAWNSTFKSAEKLQQDLVYINPHASACEYCQDHQGKIYSLTGSTFGYPLLSSVANEDGTMHPNCKHTISLYYGQNETNKYSNETNLESYEALQKINSLNLSKKRLKNDILIYSKLDDMENVDKTKQKINALNKQIREQKQKVVY